MRHRHSHSDGEGEGTRAQAWFRGGPRPPLASGAHGGAKKERARGRAGRTPEKSGPRPGSGAVFRKAGRNTAVKPSGAEAIVGQPAASRWAPPGWRLSAAAAASGSVPLRPRRAPRCHTSLPSTPLHTTEQDSPCRRRSRPGPRPAILGYSGRCLPATPAAAAAAAAGAAPVNSLPGIWKRRAARRRAQDGARAAPRCATACRRGKAA
ncbi:translation initiation factor IF-2-like [Schistocerca piceifrons]|uniref:translation initiation factor IF-2-like n=1 Tax=Schistocerca piceifrons TaxID=274613 RepID=UPI001F5F6724|nr:translation initiation factor IF-2-like [Schistocerca piceifrons]